MQNLIIKIIKFLIEYHRQSESVSRIPDFSVYEELKGSVVKFEEFIQCA